MHIVQDNICAHSEINLTQNDQTGFAMMCIVNTLTFTTPTPVGAITNTLG